MVSRVFPAYHPRKGQDTDFPVKITNAVYNSDTVTDLKLHTIRGNYPLWESRIRAINEGKAVLSLRYWAGKPYKSKQVEFCQLKGLQVGLQKIEMDMLGWFIDDKDSSVTTTDLAKNDGLYKDDFTAWFKGKIEPNDPMAIIHFTAFRY